MGRITIAVYKPLTGKENLLRSLVHEHIPILRTQGLVTDRVPIVMQAEDKSVIEIFEWKSSEAIQQAHTNPEVQKLWQRFNEVCEYSTPINIKEFHSLFSEFQPIN